MRAPPSWTTPGEIDARLNRLWIRGRLCAERLGLQADGPPLFPISLRLTRPDVRALGEQFDDVRRWIRTIEEGGRSARGFGYDIVWEEINHRQLGRNRIPVAVVVPDEEDALALIGKRRQADHFTRLASATLDPFPELRGWLSKHPFVVLEHADDWNRVLAVLTWLRSHPRPEVYLRQLEIQGVDTKFIESHKALLADLLDLVLPGDAVEAAAPGSRQFEARYGLLAKPTLVRFRLLDPDQHIAGLSDLATPAVQFARLDLATRNVFITENEVNGLAFPSMPDSLVIFGLGYGLERLGEIQWLKERTIHYWGDIDTHGFAILNRLRAGLPHVRSFLMDRETLLAHRSLWSREGTRYEGALARLTVDEGALYEDLRTDRIGPGVRLEQERVAFGWLRRALGALESG